MTICTILDSQVDHRKDGDDCAFNGFLEDYLNLEQSLDETLKEAFEGILEIDKDVKICVGLRDAVNKDAISNQIIRYKDVFKLEGKPLAYPYILYMDQEGTQRALLVVPYSEYSYIYAKGYYYCMTEPGSKFIDCKNDIVAISSNDKDQIIDAYRRLFSMRAGALQRSLDRNYFKNYDELKEACLDAAAKQKEEAVKVLAPIEERTPYIEQYIVNWFLLKKVLYVQYMVNKNLLNSRHDGNVKKQRNQAKVNADEVSFMSFSEMWRIESPTIED